MTADFDVFSIRNAPDAALARWRALSARALEPCPYLAPDYLLPLLRHVCVDVDPYVVAVPGEGASADEYGALVVLEPARPTWQVPVAHERGFLKYYSFLGGFLLSPDGADANAERLLRALKKRSVASRPLWLPQVRTDGEQWAHVAAASRAAGARWWPYSEISRPVFRPQADGADYESRLSSSARRELRKSKRRLEELGRLEWRFTRGEQVTSAQVDEFLRLENLGWKGASGTSMAADPGSVRFLRETVSAFRADGGVFVSELLLDGEVVSTTLNFAAGRTAFGFKLGWDPRFAKLGIGNLSVAELARHAAHEMPDIELIDSCAQPDTFVARLWPDRYTISDGLFTFGASQRAVIGVVQVLRDLKQRVTRRRLQATKAA